MCAVNIHLYVNSLLCVSTCIPLDIMALINSSVSGIRILQCLCILLYIPLAPFPDRIEIVPKTRTSTFQRYYLHRLKYQRKIVYSSFILIISTSSKMRSLCRNKMAFWGSILLSTLRVFISTNEVRCVIRVHVMLTYSTAWNKPLQCRYEHR